MLLAICRAYRITIYCDASMHRTCHTFIYWHAASLAIILEDAYKSIKKNNWIWMVCGRCWRISNSLAMNFEWLIQLENGALANQWISPKRMTLLLKYVLCVEIIQYFFKAIKTNTMQRNSPSNWKFLLIAPGNCDVFPISCYSQRDTANDNPTHSKSFNELSHIAKPMPTKLSILFSI